MAQLTEMLRGVHPSPEEAALELLGRFSPVVSIAVARKNRDMKTSVTPERWTVGLSLARRLVRLGLHEKVEPPPPARPDPILREKLFNAIGRLETERMVAIFADERGRMISQELVAEGAKGQLRLSMRRIFTKALNRDARRMIIAHNHPSGCAKPSKADVISTRRLNDYARSLGIVLDDHLIIGQESITSMRSSGLF